MPASPIRKLVVYSEEAKRKGIKVYHLNIGQPDLPTPEVALEAIRNIDRKILEYSPSDGFLSYREKLVKTGGHSGPTRRLNARPYPFHMPDVQGTC